MDSELNETQALSKILIETHSKILSSQNEQEKEQRDKKITQQIQEAQSIFQFRKIILDFHSRLCQDIYISNLSEKIAIMIVFYYDFPKSDPQIFATKQMTHRLIDSDTWQIKVKWNNSILLMLKEIVNQFAQEKPEDDYFLNEFELKNLDDKFQRQREAIQNLELWEIFPDYFLNQNTNIDLTPQIKKLESFKTLSKLMMERVNQNNIIGEQIQQIRIENLQLKQELEFKINQFQLLQIDGIKLNQFCSTLLKTFSNKELLRVLDKKKQMLEQYREEKYENQKNEENEKKFEIDIKEYLRKRKEYQICIQKRAICINTLQNKYQK